MRLFFSILAMLCLCSVVSLAQQGNAQAATANNLPARTGAAPAAPAAPADENVEITMLQGKVVDLDGNPLPGATLMVEGTDWITVTNGKGEYALPMKGITAAARVKCSYQGMADLSLPIPLNSPGLTIRMAGSSRLVAPTAPGKPRDL